MTPAAASGAPSPRVNVIQSAAVQHIAVGDLSAGYRLIGPLAGRPDGGAAAEKDPLLLIVGSAMTMDMWAPEFVASLAGDRVVIVFDNRGIGETDNPAGAYPLSKLADDTAGLVKALGYNRLDVLGWSMGGDVAIDMAIRHPEVVHRMIAYAGNAGGSLAVPPSDEVIATLMDTSGTPEQHGMRLLELLFPASYRAAHPDYMASFPIPTEQAAPAAINLQNQAIGEWAGVWDGLAGISCPTLFVTGTDDALTPAQNSVLMADRVPGSWLMRFAGAGHGLMYQEPKKLADAVEAFLSATD